MRDASWDGDGSLAAKKGRSGDGTVKTLTKSCILSLKLSLRNVSDGLRDWLWSLGDGSINSLIATWNSDNGTSTSKTSKVAAAKLLGSAVLEADKSTEKVVTAALGTRDDLSLGEGGIVGNTWDVGEDRAGDGSGRKKLSEMHDCKL